MRRPCFLRAAVARLRASAPLFAFLVAAACASGAADAPGAAARGAKTHPPRAPADTAQARALLTRWAPGFEILTPGITDTVIEAEVVYPSDSLRVRAFIFFPAGDTPRPAVLFNHGGVSGVSADMKRRSRDLVHEGYVVVAPAYRGEGGSEGRVEVAAGEVDDVLAAARLLARSPRVDATRLALAGSSHGALVSVLAAAREPERFRCLAEACGVMDVVSWYQYLVANGFDVSDSLSRAVYGNGPEDKPDAFRARQAIRVADRIRIPVLLQQGAQDRTVPPDQAVRFETALREAGHDHVTRLEYPLLGHAFWFWEAGRHTDDEVAEANRSWGDLLAFLARNLAKEARP